MENHDSVCPIDISNTSTGLSACLICLRQAMVLAVLSILKKRLHFRLIFLDINVA